jgi:hypothetical protein
MIQNPSSVVQQRLEENQARLWAQLTEESELACFHSIESFERAVEAAALRVDRGDTKTAVEILRGSN